MRDIAQRGILETIVRVLTLEANVGIIEQIELVRRHVATFANPGATHRDEIVVMEAL